MKLEVIENFGKGLPRREVRKTYRTTESTVNKIKKGKERKQLLTSVTEVTLQKHFFKRATNEVSEE